MGLYDSTVVLQENLVLWCIIVNQSVLWKDGIAVVRVIAKVQNFSVSSSG